MKKIYFLLIALLCNIVMYAGEPSTLSLTVMSNNDDWGTVTGSGGYQDETVFISAKSNKGYYFTGWYDVSGNLISKNSSYSFYYSSKNVAIGSPAEERIYIAMFAEDVAVSVHVSTPGTLAQEIINAGSNAALISKLIITGALDAEDYRIMRETASWLHDVDLSGVTNTYIPASAFSGKSTLQFIVLPENLISIGDKAFYDCDFFTSIRIPNNVITIGNNAFQNCSSLKSITLPIGITVIGEDAFLGCSSLNEIKFNVDDLERYINSGINGRCYDKISSTAIRKLYENNVEMSDLVIPNTITTIPEYTFSNCEYLSSITVPNSVTSIGESAFYNCKYLTSLTIGNKVFMIGDNAFSNCSFLSLLTLYTTNPPKLIGNALEGIPSSVLIKVPCGSSVKYKETEYWGNFANYEEAMAGTLIVDVNDATMGSATIIKQNSCADDVAQVQALALPGYEFVRWSDGAIENPHTVVVTKDMTIIAEFRKIEEESGGDEKHSNFIVESADKTQGAVKIIIMAEAIKGFEFSHWSDGSTENPRIVTLDEDVELYAYFRVAVETALENSVISSANVYGNNGTLYVEGAETDYHVLDAAGRLVYSGRESALSLPRGVYVVNVGGEVQKVVI